MVAGRITSELNSLAFIFTLVRCLTEVRAPASAAGSIAHPDKRGPSEIKSLKWKGATWCFPRFHWPCNFGAILQKSHRNPAVIKTVLLVSCRFGKLKQQYLCGEQTINIQLVIFKMQKIGTFIISGWKRLQLPCYEPPLTPSAFIPPERLYLGATSHSNIHWLSVFVSGEGPREASNNRNSSRIRHPALYL